MNKFLKTSSIRNSLALLKIRGEYGHLYTKHHIAADLYLILEKRLLRAYLPPNYAHKDVAARTQGAVGRYAVSPDYLLCVAVFKHQCPFARILAGYVKLHL